METEENVRRFWAFISYSHADKPWADWLHKSLELTDAKETLEAIKKI